MSEMRHTIRVLNKHIDSIPNNAVYIGRPSKWGNPFVIGVDGTRAEVVIKYEVRLMQTPKLLADISELKGKSLVCFCSPQPCHGDVLFRLANQQ